MPSPAGPHFFLSLSHFLPPSARHSPPLPPAAAFFFFLKKFQVLISPPATSLHRRPSLTVHRLAPSLRKPTAIHTQVFMYFNLYTYILKI
jgi:hypothetical protein